MVERWVYSLCRVATSGQDGLVRPRKCINHVALENGAEEGRAWLPGLYLGSADTKQVHHQVQPHKKHCQCVASVHSVDPDGYQCGQEWQFFGAQSGEKRGRQNATALVYYQRDEKAGAQVRHANQGGTGAGRRSLGKIACTTT